MTDNTVIFQLQVGTAELAIWMSLFPVAVERARQTYTHLADCAYAKNAGESSLCQCGMGKDLPPAFVRCMNTSGTESLLPRFYRAALSPFYLPPGMVSPQRDSEKVVATRQNVPNGPQGVVLGSCGKCGKKSAPLLCSRCRQVNYCSKECQRLAWKTHKPLCSR